MKEKWRVYDSKMKPTNKIITRGDSLEKGEYHLSVHIWLENENGEILLQKRSRNKEHFPELWSTITGGVILDEKPIDAIMRETEEEIGIQLNKYEIRELGMVQRTYDFVIIYRADLRHKYFKVNQEELEKVEVMNRQKIEELIKQGKMAESVIEEYNKFIRGGSYD